MSGKAQKPTRLASAAESRRGAAPQWSRPGTAKRIWLNKRLYEGLPFAYIGAGMVWLAAGLYLRDGAGPVVFTILGLACVTGGLVLCLKRRDYRSSRSRSAFDERP